MSTSADGRSIRWAAHRATRRRELVESTIRAIRAHGATVGMDEIASTAGTSKTVFYRHFTDRAGLYLAVAEHVDRLIIQDVTAALGRRATSLTDIDEQPRTLIAGAIDAYLELVERDPEVYRFVVSAPLLDRADPTAPADPAGDVSGHVAEQMGMVIRDALLEVGADPGPAFVWGHGLVGLVRAAADAWLAAGPDREPRSTMTGYLTTLAWSGLSCAWPTHSATGGQVTRRG